MIVQAIPRVTDKTPYSPISVGKRAMRLAVGETSSLSSALLLCLGSKIDLGRELAGRRQGPDRTMSTTFLENHT